MEQSQDCHNRTFFFVVFFPSQELVGRLRAVRIFVHVLTARTVTLNFGAVSKGGGKKRPSLT